MPCLGHVSGNAGGWGDGGDISKAIEEGNQLGQQPCPAHYGLVVAKDLGGLFFMAMNVATLGRGLVCYCNFSKKVESGLFWAGDRISDSEAGLRRDARARSRDRINQAYGQRQREKGLRLSLQPWPMPALPVSACEKPMHGAIGPWHLGESFCSRYSPTFSEELTPLSHTSWWSIPYPFKTEKARRKKRKR